MSGPSPLGLTHLKGSALAPKVLRKDVWAVRVGLGSVPGRKAPPSRPDSDEPSQVGQVDHDSLRRRFLQAIPSSCGSLGRIDSRRSQRRGPCVCRMGHGTKLATSPHRGGRNGRPVKDLRDQARRCPPRGPGEPRNASRGCNCFWEVVDHERTSRERDPKQATTAGGRSQAFAALGKTGLADYASSRNEHRLYGDL